MYLAMFVAMLAHSVIVCCCLQMFTLLATHTGTRGAFRNASGKDSTADELNQNDQGPGHHNLRATQRILMYSKR